MESEKVGREMDVQLSDCNPDTSEGEGSSQPSQKCSFYPRPIVSNIAKQYMPILRCVTNDKRVV